MNLTADVIADCRERGGEALEDRPERIDTALTRPQLGWQEGQPLAADSYSEYPQERTDLALPEYGDFLRCLLGHDRVGSWDDAVAELTGATHPPLLADWLESLESAAAAHGLDTDSLFEGGGQEGESPLTAVLEYRPPAEMVAADNPLLIAELYCLGLSIEEIAHVLEAEIDGSVKPATVSGCLKDVGLLEGKTQQQQYDEFVENGAKLGRKGSTNSSGGLTVDTSEL